MNDYEEASRTLMEECMKRRQLIIDKSKDHIIAGLDGDPVEKELRQVSRWFQLELDKLRDKYGLRKASEK